MKNQLNKCNLLDNYKTQKMQLLLMNPCLSNKFRKKSKESRLKFSQGSVTVL